MCVYTKYLFVMLIKKIVRRVKETRYIYMIDGANVRIQGRFVCPRKNVVLKRSVIYVDKGSTLILHDYVRLSGIKLMVLNGAKVEIDSHSILEKGNNAVRPNYIINGGSLKVEDHVKLACQRVWIRYGGVVRVGRYTNINEGSELRSDEHVNIGEFCGLSYNLRIWDTNTHCIYPPEKRRALMCDKFPDSWFENEKPQTAPVVIGNGCWIGEKSSILKGTVLGDNVIVGYNTTMIGEKIPENKKVVQELKLRVL